MRQNIVFLQEARRPRKKNCAPKLAAFVNTVVTVVLLGMLIPIFQTAQGKSEEVRNELSVQYALFPDATKAEIAATKTKLQGLSDVARVKFVGKAEALKKLESELEDKRIVE